MLNSKRNLKVFSLILLTSALLLTIGANIASVKAQTQDSVFAYTTLGGTISANGSTLTGGSTTTYGDGSTISFSATASSGFKFLCWEYAGASGAITSTTNPLSYTISTSEIAIEAIFIPTTSTTPTTTGSGSASVDLFPSIGGTTDPAGASAPYNNYTIGATDTFTQTPGDGFKFLCWISQTSTASTLSTNSPFSLEITDSNVALQALWIPTSSTVTLPSASPSPTVPEYSNVAAIVVALALAAVAFGTYAYRRKTK